MRVIYIERAILIAATLFLTLLLDGCATNNNQRFSDYHNGCMVLANYIIDNAGDSDRVYVSEAIPYFCIIKSQEEFSEE